MIKSKYYLILQSLAAEVEEIKIFFKEEFYLLSLSM